MAQTQDFFAPLRARYGQTLTQEQISHIEGIIARFAERAYQKYAAGQAEHGGDLWHKPVVGQIMLEAIDMLVYCDTLEQQAGNGGVVL